MIDMQFQSGCMLLLNEFIHHAANIFAFFKKNYTAKYISTVTLIGVPSRISFIVPVLG